MSYTINIPAPLGALIDGFPLRTRVAVYGALERILQHVELWGPDDAEGWAQLAWQDGDWLRFYADGCCMRVEVQPDEQRLVLREIGRVLVHLSSEELAYRQDVLGSPLEH